MDFFVDFYSNLSNMELFIFWGIVTIFIFLFIFCVSLAQKNKQLRKILQSKKEDKIVVYDDILPIKEEVNIEECIIKEEKPKVKILEREEVIKVSSIPSEEKNKLYKENILRGIAKQTSPINITSKNKKEEENIQNVSYIEKLSQQLEKEPKPNTIELTDYEKKQEDEAIISYKELLDVKDRLYNITEEEEDFDFIEELKTFRNNLQN